MNLLLTTVCVALPVHRDEQAGTVGAQHARQRSGSAPELLCGVLAGRLLANDHDDMTAGLG